MATTDPAVERLAKLDTCAVSDALDRLGMEGVVREIRRLAGGRFIAARVRTIRLGIFQGVHPASHLGTSVLETLVPGYAVVVANEGRREAAAWGGLLTRVAKARGCAGVVVDGAVRDLDELDELGVPVYGRTNVPVSGRGRYVQLETDSAVRVSGVRVRCDDLLLVDGSGLVCIDSDRASDVLDEAERIASIEARMARGIERGSSPSRVLGGAYERLTTRRG